MIALQGDSTWLSVVMPTSITALAAIVVAWVTTTNRRENRSQHTSVGSILDSHTEQIREVRSDVREVKSDVADVKADVRDVRGDIRDIANGMGHFRR